MATDAGAAVGAGPRKLSSTTARRRRTASGPDRLTVVLLSLAAFLVVLGLLAGQMSASAARAPAPRVVLLRKLVRTTVLETVTGGAGRPAAVSSSQSSSVSGGSVSGGSVPAAPTTRTS